MRTLLVLLLSGWVGTVAAQNRNELGPAFQLERQGRYAEAAVEYRRVLTADPTSAVALYGLERVLQSLNRLPELLPHLDTALARQPADRAVRGLQLRVLGTLGDGARLTAAAEEWIAVDGAASDPWREWAFALAQRGNALEARLVLERGHERLGGGELLPELAQIAVMTGDWAGAARHWLAAVRSRPEQAGAAAVGLSQAPPAARDAVIQGLLRGADPAGRRLAAEILVGWNRPGEAWVLLDANLPANRGDAAQVLQRFADRARVVGTREHHRVRGFALERLGGLVSGPAAQQARIEAARAFADAGERPAAERMLEQIAADSAAAPQSAISAMATLIAVEADAGRVEQAERRLGEWRERLAAEDVSALRERIGWAWIRRGDLARAERILTVDSTLGTMAVLGWVALYRGDLGGALERFREVGPFTGTRADATDRTAMLALMQRIAPDSAPALGAALLLLARGDTVRAARELADAARTLPAQGGRADVLVFAAQLALAHEPTRAETLLRDALAADPDGAATPVAEFTLAQLAATAGRRDDAVARLERLILAYPESAVVPQARRLLDQVRGAIPKS